MNPSSIKAFCIDFNWDYVGRWASPGLFAQADPKAHVDWYEDLGANTIQTFCVGFNGYAWYPSGAAPVTPGLRRNFLGELTQLAHDRGLRVMGYFCLASNPHWSRLHPEQTHPRPLVGRNLPLTTEYLDYFCRCVADALVKSDIDGYMIDWFNLPEKRERFLDCEKQMWLELMEEPFPAADPPADLVLEFDRRSLSRAWRRIKQASDSCRRALIWLNHPFTQPDDPLWTNLPMLRQADWVLNELQKPEFLTWLSRQIGPHTRLIQCLCGMADHDASVAAALDSGRFGLYGYAHPDPVTTLPAPDIWEKNWPNIVTLRKLFREH